MGLKSGSRDAGVDESGESDENEEAVSPDPTERGDPDSEIESQRASSSNHGDNVVDNSRGGTEVDSPGRPTIQSIPYKQRREKVNEGRQQVPFFVREKESEFINPITARLR